MLLADLEAATVDWVPNFDASVVRFVAVFAMLAALHLVPTRLPVAVRCPHTCCDAQTPKCQ